MKPITICALFFGDHLDLAQRTLGSIERALPETGLQVVEEFRIALNGCTDRVSEWVEEWARRMPGSVWFYRTGHNQFKYPIMRQMLRRPTGVRSPYVMWFDDDSYFEDHVDEAWWTRMLGNMAHADMIGQIWTMAVQGNQLEWVKTQPWFNPAVPLEPKKVRGKPSFEFCQGAWWVARTEMLRKYDWPVAEIRHNGGDSMLGELMRHQQLRMVRFISGSNDKHDGVRINANGRGQHSKNPRRGHNENRVGWDFEGKPLDTSHQDFACEVAGLVELPRSPDIIDLFQ